jgi:hypothetical protein
MIEDIKLILETQCQWFTPQRLRQMLLSYFSLTTHTHTGQGLWSVSGALSVATGAVRIYNQFGADKTISKVFIAVNTAPTGASLIVDVHKNGTTIFTNQANRPAITASNNTGTTTTIDVATFASGDYLTIDIDQIGSTVAGSDLTVHVVYS